MRENKEDIIQYACDLEDKICNLNSKITSLQQENEYLKKANDEATKIGVADHKYASQMEDKVIMLQQENERLKYELNVFKNDKVYERLGKLREENERLKELVDADNESYDIQEAIINRQKSELLEQEDYKSRCEKAIGIIKKEKENMGYAKYDSCLLLIENILQNGSGKDG